MIAEKEDKLTAIKFRGIKIDCYKILCDKWLEILPKLYNAGDNELVNNWLLLE